MIRRESVRSSLLSQRHYRWLMFRLSGHHASIFLDPFAPPELPGFNATMSPLTPAESLPDTRQVSLLHEQGLPTIPPPTTWLLRRSLYHVTLQRRRPSNLFDLGFTIRRQARQTTRPRPTCGRCPVHFRCGLAVRFPMLSTPPHGDAVSVSYKPENVYLKRTSTSPSMFTRKRTLLSLRDPGRPSTANRATRERRLAHSVFHVASRRRVNFVGSNQ